MFDIGAPELLVIVIVAILVIGPKELPRALRLAGQWIGKVRRISGHFRSGVESMIREAEMEEMDKKWKAQNEAIMAAHPADQMQPLDAPVSPGPQGDPGQVDKAAEAPKDSASDSKSDDPPTTSPKNPTPPA